MTASTSTGPQLPAHATADPAISVQGLVKHYSGRPVLAGITFDVRPGEIFGILGRNGAGKTTALEILQGLRSRDGGDVRIAGHDPAYERARLRAVVGSQLQSSALPERIRVAEALRLFARIAGDVVDWRALRHEWDLTGVSATAFGNLSGGERQRLFIALALVNRPRVVFLDELTQGLDPSARRETWRLIGRVREEGATVLLVSHDMEEIEQLCDRIAVLDAGTFKACGTPAELVGGLRGPVHIAFSAGAEEIAGLDTVPGVLEVSYDGERARVLGDAASPVLVAAELVRRGLVPADFTVQRPSLADVFMSMTGTGR